MLLAGTSEEEEEEEAPPGLTSDSAKEVRLSADGYRCRGDRREDLLPALREKLNSAVPCDALDPLGDGEGVLPSGAAALASPQDSWVLLEPLLF